MSLRSTRILFLPPPDVVTRFLVYVPAFYAIAVLT